MRTVVYLSNKQVQVVIGSPGQNKISVSQIYTGEAPDGSIINGIVMDNELFVGFMKEFWKTYNIPTKDIVFVINSSKFIGKTLEIPVLNEKKTLEYIRREFADLNRGEDLIYGMIPIGMEGKNRKVYVEGMSAEFIKDYMDIFAEIGLKVNAIHSGEGSLIALIQMTLGQRFKTFILEIADSMTITTLLWVNGSFYYFNSVRCFHEQGTEDYANDIAKSVSQVTQFMQAHQIENHLETVVLAGINPLNLFMYQNALSMQGMQIPVMLFEDTSIHAPSLEIQYQLHAASGLVTIGNGKWQNYLQRFIASGKKKEEKKTPKGLIAIVAVLAAMLILLGVALTVKNTRKRKLKDLEEYNSKPDIQMQVARVSYLTERVNFLTDQYGTILQVIGDIYTYPVCNDVITSKILSCANKYAMVSFESFDADNGIVTMTAKAESVDDINVFIKALTNEDIFCAVDYTGYSFNEAEGMWDIHVTVTLAESAGR